MRASRLLILMMSALFTVSAQAGLYRWVDEFGAVHYGDKVPAKYLKQEHQELNEQGTTVKNPDRALTSSLNVKKLKLATQQGVQQGHQIKREEVIVQFDGYIERFRELMAEKQKKREAYEKRKAARNRAASGLTSIEE